MFNPQPFSQPVTIAGEAPSVSVGGQGRSDYWPSTLRHPETPPQQFSLSPKSSPATPSSTASNHSRGPELGDVQWSGARGNYGSPLAVPDVEGFGYDNRLGDALQPRSPARSLARLSICSASTSSSGISSLASRGAYSCSSSGSSASSPPVYTNTSMPSEDAMVPKLEEFEDEDQLMSTPPLSCPGPVQEPTGKRGRGRPRKHPLTIAKTVQKSTKGRSKTGCATCRRRKKKCDEAKPECNNCIKNSVQCEGYPEKKPWQAGRKAQARGISAAASVSITPSLPHLVEGVITKNDRRLLDHFDKRVSRILTLHDDKNNPFHNYLLPLAMHNEALMHSLLALSSSHLSNTYPLDRDFEAAQPQHIGDALRLLREGIGRTGPDDTHLATSLVLCLDSICRGNIEGSYKPHLNAARTMLRQHGEEINPLALFRPHVEEANPLRQFLYEFFKYHEVINSITILNDEMQLYDDTEISELRMSPSSSPSMLGVFDGLFVHMSRISQFRRVIRVRRMHGMQPRVDGAMLLDAVDIDNDLHEWQSPHEPGSPQYIASQLYLHCTWIYLWRTIQDRDDVHKIRTQVELGLECLRKLPENSGTQSNLLMPLFMLGCAAFYPEQRPEIVERFESLQKWSSLRNVWRALNVVRKVWELMDEGKTEHSWDWEIIIKDMGYDFLIT